MHQPQPVSLMHERRNADCACVCILWIIAERSIINSHKSCWDQIINFFVHFISFVSFSHWFAWLLLVRISRENLFCLQMYFILCARPLMVFFLTFCSVCVCVFFFFLNFASHCSFYSTSLLGLSNAVLNDWLAAELRVKPVSHSLHKHWKGLPNDGIIVFNCLCFSTFYVFIYLYLYVCLIMLLLNISVTNWW